jgi:hypothetical protein
MPMTQVVREVVPGKRIVRVQLDTPKMGGKCFLLESKGIFVLESCPGVLRTIACTHAGAGNVEAIDGVPDDHGFFPDDGMLEPHRSAFDSDQDFIEAMAKYCTRNGRVFYRANPVVMGSWFLDAGFEHGLTIRAAGGHDSASAIASVVFMPYRVRPKANA